MNKYTVIYGRYFRVGIHTNSVTCYSHIEGETVDDAVEKSNINWNDIWFIFDGHCVQTVENKSLTEP